MDKPAAILKPGKEKPLLNKHHWIFSGAVATIEGPGEGEILPVYSHKGQLLGSGYFNRRAGIVGRMLTFDATPPDLAIERLLEGAIRYREQLFDPAVTNGYRLINGEGDRLPGLIVDRYGDYLVIQIATLGMERLKHRICERLQRRLGISQIYEKSNLPTRKEEGLPPTTGPLLGDPPEAPVEIRENGLLFAVDIVKGQKTGFFCDHRNMRQMVRAMASGKKVLNCFSYSGGFSAYAMAGGAQCADSVEISEQAIGWARTNCQLNGFADSNVGFYCDDVFDFLRQNPLDYDLVILDPPAFAKKQKDVVAACRGYKEINRLAMEKMKPGSWLLSCSCSYHVDESLFQKILFQAAVEAGRDLKIAGKHLLAADHPINLCHPEGDYLKSFLLHIS
jgi:23S rRNA (cytosine1962-C5)-methyltransferase